jgi:hypothetical protein
MRSERAEQVTQRAAARAEPAREAPARVEGDIVDTS